MPTHNLQITFLFFLLKLPPPPQSYTFRQLNSIDHTFFLDDLKQSSLIQKRVEKLRRVGDYQPSAASQPSFGWIRHYLHSFLDKHAPVTTKRSTRHSPSQPWFTESLRTTRRAGRQAESIYRSTHSSSDHSSFRSLRNQYHKLVLAAKTAYYSFMVKSSSDCPRRQWNTINNILHRKSSSLLPSSVSLSVLASQFAIFFKE